MNDDDYVYYPTLVDKCVSDSKLLVSFLFRQRTDTNNHAVIDRPSLQYLDTLIVCAALEPFFFAGPFLDNILHSCGQGARSLLENLYRREIYWKIPAPPGAMVSNPHTDLPSS